MTHCLLSNARDMCVVVRTSADHDTQRFLISGRSVTCAAVPSVHGTVRATVFASGWIVEPYACGTPAAGTGGSSVYSKVTYITQVDIGGKVPAAVINLVAVRQPLSIHYVRLQMLEEQAAASGVKDKVH